MRLVCDAVNKGVIKNISERFSKEETLEFFSKMCRIRFFELNVKNAYDAKLIKCPVYLSVGQEAIAAALSLAMPNPYIFAQHRAHDLYISYGGNLRVLRDELLHLLGGCAQGMGGSASIHSPGIGMMGHDGHMGTQVPIAMGYTLFNDLEKRPVLAVMGDASIEEDYIFPTLGWAVKRKAPILFVCFDNNLSILTEVRVRRNWSIVDVARSLGLMSFGITDDPWLIMHHVRSMKDRHLPAFLNVYTSRHFWHSGTGIDGRPEWDRYELVAYEIKKLGFAKEAFEIMKDTRKEINDIWNERIDWKKSCLR